VSPLETIKTIVQEPENVLFAHNLYQNEIADALIRAMNDDKLVGDAYDANYQLVLRLADRATIKRKVIDFYNNLADVHDKSSSLTRDLCN
jgi:hypothetical protein